jgi:hypothetical protein
VDYKCNKFLQRILLKIKLPVIHSTHGFVHLFIHLSKPSPYLCSQLSCEAAHGFWGGERKEKARRHGAGAGPEEVYQSSRADTKHHQGVA